MSYEEFPWLRQARDEYKLNLSCGLVSTTHLSRGFDLFSELQRLMRFTLFQGAFDSRPIDILAIGAGKYSQKPMGDKVAIVGGLELYALTAELEHAGLDYNLTVLDLDEESLDLINSQRRLFVADSYLKKRKGEYAPSMNGRLRAWQGYLQITGQRDNVTRTLLEGLDIRPKELAPQLLDIGVHYAKIPSGLAQKLDDGEVDFICGDIATTDLGESRFDFATSNFVLYQVPLAGQKLAIANIARSLRNPGAFFYHEPSQFRSRDVSVIRNKGEGWMTDELLDDLGLSFDDLGVYYMFDQAAVLFRGKYTFPNFGEE